MWVSVCAGFAMCGCMCVGVLVICVLVFTVFCIVCTVFFLLFRLCIFIYFLFCLYSCKDYCQSVTTQLQLGKKLIIIKK